MRSDWILKSKYEARLLLEQESPGDFLKIYYKFTKSHWPGLSYSGLAREMNISKSLVIGIFNGSKSLSPKNIPFLVHALKLPKPVEDYFETLISMENSLKRRKVLHNIREGYLESLDTVINVNTTISDPDFALVYAALGEEDRGSTIEEIIQKIHLPEERIRFLLNELRVKGFVKLTPLERWAGTKKFLTAVANSKNEWLPNLFHSTLEHHQKIAKKNFFSQDHLSLTYTFCVKEQDCEALNVELKDLMAKLMKKYHDGNGEKVLSLLLGTHVH